MSKMEISIEKLCFSLFSQLKSIKQITINGAYVCNVTVLGVNKQDYWK